MIHREAYELAVKNGPSLELEEVIATSAWFSYCYACDVLKKPFPLGEPAIAVDPGLSCDYAILILKGPFRSAELTISKNIRLSYLYAKNALKHPFPLGEPAIFLNHNRSLDYQFRFNRLICLPIVIEKYPAYALSYAIMIGGRFPRGEPAMKKSPRIWKKYQEFIDDPRKSV